MRRAGVNQSTKRAAVLLGGVLFLFHLVPLAQQIDNFMYPRDQMDTYLHKDLDIAKFGFNITIVDEHSLVRQSLFEKDPKSIAFYNRTSRFKVYPSSPACLGSGHYNRA